MLVRQNGEAKPGNFLCISMFLMDFFTLKKNNRVYKNLDVKGTISKVTDIYSKNSTKNKINITTNYLASMKIKYNAHVC